jgi:hypothetical protein
MFGDEIEEISKVQRSAVALRNLIKGRGAFQPCGAANNKTTLTYSNRCSTPAHLMKGTTCS